MEPFAVNIAVSDDLLDGDVDLDAFFERQFDKAATREGRARIGAVTRTMTGHHEQHPHTMFTLNAPTEPRALDVETRA